jgi:histidyl-tRNA synthetase
MKLKAVRGTKDIFGDDAVKYDYIVETAKKIFTSYGYSRIITPIFEETSLFKRGIGEGTDIVEKEMYTFLDKGERSVTLRPEGTASIVRSYLEHKVYGKEDSTKYFYHGPMFRYERPQAGRYREFNQIGVEAIGGNSPILDAETISMGYKLLEALGLEELEVQINSVGGNASRVKYRQKLVDFLSDKKDVLCEDCKTRYYKNPLRVLDCKNQNCQDITKDAPNLVDSLSIEENEHYSEVKKYLEVFGVNYSENPRLVRGLDYYSNTVFEIVTNKLGAQGTVLAGGRYDGLLKTIGDKDIPAVGFAAGIERIMLLLGDNVKKETPKVYIAWLGDEVKEYAFKVAETLRKSYINSYIEFDEKSMRAHMKKADKLGINFAVIIGTEEMESGKVLLKNLAEREQESLGVEEVAEKLSK